jgi:hypothetical protein
MATLQDQKNILEFASIAKLMDDSVGRNIKIVAEGDSWFAYPLHKDILDHLREKGYAINKLSKAGDTLENMVYNSSSIENVLSCIRLQRPGFVLFSAGGNDVVGPEISQYLNHKESNLPLLNEISFRNNMFTVVKKYISDFIEKVLKVDDTVKVIMHGYDYAKPNGKGFDIMGFKIKGPWILPSFISKGINSKDEQNLIINMMVNTFNEVLIELQHDFQNSFYHVDLRGKFLNESEWDNEIHLRNNGYKKVAEIIHKKITSILGEEPTLEQVII